ncbi:HAMP domain-containing sensor histidine kinase [Bacillus spongiae]|uniref:histidine kinase n=1 Tax=Bacillus spongiae TaxID=2683610 RepID=A0ABU8HJ90_9BACI
MDTKWKNRWVLGIWLILLTFGFSGLVLFKMNGLFYTKSDYSETYAFKDQYFLFIQDLEENELNGFTLEEAKTLISLPDIHSSEYGFIDTSGIEIERIKEEYEYALNSAIDTGNLEEVESLIVERNEKIEEIKKSAQSLQSDEYVMQEILKEREQQIEDYYKESEIKSSFFKEQKNDFLYHFINQTNGEIYTNIPNLKGEVENYFNENNMVYVAEESIPIGRDLLNRFGWIDIPPELSGMIDGWIAVPTSSTNAIAQEFEKYEQEQIVFILYVLISIVALILCFFIGRKSKSIHTFMEKWSAFLYKLPVDVRISTFLIVVLLGLTFSNHPREYIWIPWLRFWYRDYAFIDLIMLSLIVAVVWLLLFLYGKSILTNIKKGRKIKQEWSKSLLYKLFTNVEKMVNRSFRFLVVLLIAIIVGLCIASLVTALNPNVVYYSNYYLVILEFFIILLVVIGIPVIIILVRRSRYLNNIIEKTNELVAGERGEELPTVGDHSLVILAGNINKLEEGVKLSLNEQAKSERLKTELITNVSHDLRTPLTSIITYTELLKVKGASNEEKEAYLDIIDRKSKRLKLLIDDLFEVSKMASGNMELTKHRVDLVQLLQQALAEHDNAINDSSLQFRITNPKEPVLAIVDGQKLWRVFDNLIGNTLKYALENSRVYIDISMMKNRALITFKNVSKYELSQNTDELFERFKRGDASRHTEGSGLGLAIAKSIVDLHGGEMDIEADGDLFKIRISLKINEDIETVE